jgi:hypothetical protein
MSIDEKIAALSQTDKAYIRGYVERAIYDSRKKKRKVKAGTSKNEAKGK